MARQDSKVMVDPRIERMKIGRRPTLREKVRSEAPQSFDLKYGLSGIGDSKENPPEEKKQAAYRSARIP